MFAPPVANGKNRTMTLASSQFGGSGRFFSSMFESTLNVHQKVKLLLGVDFMSWQMLGFHFFN